MQQCSVERQVFNDTVRGFHPLNSNVILYDNGNRNAEASMVLFKLCKGIYVPPNASNNIL